MKGDTDEDVGLGGGEEGGKGTVEGGGVEVTQSLDAGGSGLDRRLEGTLENTNHRTRNQVSPYATCPSARRPRAGRTLEAAIMAFSTFLSERDALRSIVANSLGTSAHIGSSGWLRKSEYS